MKCGCGSNKTPVLVSSGDRLLINNAIITLSSICNAINAFKMNGWDNVYLNNFRKSEANSSKIFYLFSLEYIRLIHTNTWFHIWFSHFTVPKIRSYRFIYTIYNKNIKIHNVSCLLIVFTAVYLRIVTKPESAPDWCAKHNCVIYAWVQVLPRTDSPTEKCKQRAHLVRS